MTKGVCCFLAITPLKKIKRMTVNRFFDTCTCAKIDERTENERNGFECTVIVKAKTIYVLFIS